MKQPAEGDVRLEALIRALRKVDPQIISTEIADAIFLGIQIWKEHPAALTQPHSEHAEHDPIATTRNLDDGAVLTRDTKPEKDQPHVDELGARDISAGSSPQSFSDAPANRRGDLYADVASVGGEAARRVNVPAGRALSDALGIVRALRPIMPRVRSRTRLTLDVESTVEYAAALRLSKTKMWLPIQRPERERWLSVDVLIDDAPTMAPWRETFDQFWRLLRASGGFRDVHGWTWEISSARPMRLEHAEAHGRALYRLPAASGERLVLAVTDCLGYVWHDGTAFGHLADWGRIYHVALLQVLPEHLWALSALGNVDDVCVRASAPGAANRLLPIEPLPTEDVFKILARLGANEGYPAAAGNIGRQPVPIPLVTLDPKQLRPWAHLVAGRAGFPMLAFLATSSPRAESLESDWSLPNGTSVHPELGARRLVERFRSYASPEARRLAVYLTAAAPLTLSVIRVIRDALISQPSEAQIAEILMADFLRAIPRRGKEDPAYDWVPGVQRLLSFGLKSSDLASVRCAVTNWMRGHADSPRGLSALTPDLAGDERVGRAETTQPFAALYGEDLRNRYLEAETRAETRRSREGDPNAVNSIFSDIDVSAAELYDIFGFPGDDSAGSEKVVIALTFAAVPRTGVLDTDMLYRILIAPDRRISRPGRDDNSLSDVLTHLEAGKNKYLKIWRRSEVRVKVDHNKRANLRFMGFPGGSFSVSIETNKSVSVQSPGGHQINAFVGGRDDAFFNDLTGFFRSINYAPQFYHVLHTMPDARELMIPKTLLELEGNDLFNYDPQLPRWGHGIKKELPGGPQTWSGSRFKKDENGNFRFVYSGEDARAGQNCNAIILELPLSFLTATPAAHRVVNAWGESWVLKASGKVQTIPDDPWWIEHPHGSVARTVDRELKKYKLVDTEGQPFVDGLLSERETNRQLGANNFWLAPHFIKRLGHLGWGFGPSITALGLASAFDHDNSPVSIHRTYASVAEAFPRVKKILFQELNMPDDSWNRKGLKIPLRRPLDIFIPNVNSIDMDTTGTWPFGRCLEDQVATRFLSIFLDMSASLNGKRYNVELLNDPALWNTAPIEPKTPPNPLKNDKEFLPNFPYLAEPW